VGADAQGRAILHSCAGPPDTASEPTQDAQGNGTDGSTCVNAVRISDVPEPPSARVVIRTPVPNAGCEAAPAQARFVDQPEDPIVTVEVLRGRRRVTTLTGPPADRSTASCHRACSPRRQTAARGARDFPRHDGRRRDRAARGDPPRLHHAAFELVLGNIWGASPLRA
jgi:hypothetical protein